MSWIAEILVASTSAPSMTIRPILEPSNEVKACQTGYLPSEPKLAMVTAAATGPAQVRRVSEGRVMATAPIGPEQRDADTGDLVRWVDFSRVRAEGD